MRKRFFFSKLFLSLCHRQSIYLRTIKYCINTGNDVLLEWAGDVERKQRATRETPSIVEQGVCQI